MSIELHVPDFNITEKFYNKLDFKTIWRRNPESEIKDENAYMVMQSPHEIIRFWCGSNAIYNQSYFKKFAEDTPKGVGVEIIIQSENLHTLYKKFTETPHLITPLKIRPWHLEDFRIIDPWGYYIRVTTPHDITKMENAIQNTAPT